ncbi:hypothetical protein, partial [Pseudomonas aeruginosa]
MAQAPGLGFQLAAALVVIATFSLFTLYNDSLQRTSIREDLEDY